MSREGNEGKERGKKITKNEVTKREKYKSREDERVRTRAIELCTCF